MSTPKDVQEIFEHVKSCVGDTATPFEIAQVIADDFGEESFQVREDFHAEPVKTMDYDDPKCHTTHRRMKMSKFTLVLLAPDNDVVTEFIYSSGTSGLEIGEAVTGAIQDYEVMMEEQEDDN